MTIRPATLGDIPRIFEIRNSVGENRLSDPSVVTEAHVASFIANEALWVWQEADGIVTGFAGSDRRDGSIWALFVAPGHEGKGIGRALLKHACDALRAAGHTAAILTTEPGTRAERHYRADGWSVSGTSPQGELIFRKKLDD
jgi:GNAT superfamily N-acetyltransferase